MYAGVNPFGNFRYRPKLSNWFAVLDTNNIFDFIIIYDSNRYFVRVNRVDSASFK
jgi:hypothetical protein